MIVIQLQKVDPFGQGPGNNTHEDTAETQSLQKI
jgi:hypothetical protein